MSILFRSSTLVFILACVATCFVSGCSTHIPHTRKPQKSASRFAGIWNMDLSPAQDGSYIKDLVIMPDAGRYPMTFTGTVYSGSAFDNGLLCTTPHATCLSMVSDEKGEMGGPYYWIGVDDGRGGLRGRVRSLTRSMEME